MKRNRATLLSAIAMVLLAAASVAAQEAGAGGEDAADRALSLSGTVEGGLSLLAGEGMAFEDPSWSGGALGLSLAAEARPSEGLRVYAELRLDEELPLAIASDAALASLAGLGVPAVRLLEAWASLQDAPIPGTELRVGRQRIAWGPADTIGIVDAFDVPDFTDLGDFGAKLASDALRLRWFGSRFGLDFAWTPFFRPAPLPGTIPAALMPSASPSLPGMTVNAAAPALASPGTDPWAASTLGGRITWEPSGWTFGASYIYGRSPTPAPYKVVITPTATPGTLEAASYLEWPRRQQFSLDLAGELFGLGVWAEGALVLPDRSYTVDLSDPALVFALDGDMSTTTSDDPYGRWLVGLDYTFANDLYVNFQYLRGMAWENLPDAQNDWAVLALKWELAGGALVIGPLAAAFEVDGLADIIAGDRELADSYGMALSPSISYKPYDGVELKAGLAWLSGAKSTALGAMSGSSRLDFGTKISF